MIFRPLTLKAALVAAVIIGGLVVIHQCQNAYRHQGARSVALTQATTAVAKAETVYVHTRDAATTARTQYHATVQPFTLSTEPAAIRTIVGAADHVVAADSTALADCDTLVARKDSLIRVLRMPKPEPWITPFVSALYGPAHHDIVGIAGLTTRPILGGWHPTAEVIGPTKPALYVGLTKTF